MSYSKQVTDTGFSLIDMSRTWYILTESDRDKIIWVDTIVALLEEKGWVEKEILD